MLAVCPLGDGLAHAAGERGLERALAGSGIPAEERGQIAKAFRSALAADVAERDLLSTVEACAGADFDAMEIVRVITVATQLTIDSLPTDAFFAKVREGVLKRVPSATVVQVAEQRALAIKRAATLLGGFVTEGLSAADRRNLLPEVAEALAAGTDPEEVRRILAEALKAGSGVGEVRRKLFP